ncbi:glycosyltransferase family 4 protein [Rhizosaccharibacter radicis]|uniref:Glycosyltransferase family 4 protein n=1 Tax=Rhizosaccharibacter radicis TaxID=2782605 RepID=A0ABT1VVG7_9PROT|nr:glycosyltransferase family 4 protein [Acetobacteraceae bacterium KSS12]
MVSIASRNNEPRVLQVLPALQSGGVERGTIEMARAIADAGGTPFVASAGGRMVPLLDRIGAVHLPLPLASKDPLTIWLNGGRLARLIRRHGISLVHARSRAPAWSARRGARLAAVPFVTTWHGVYSENFPGKKHYNRIMAAGDRVIAISDYVAGRIATQYGVGPDRLRIIPRGADASSFDPAMVRGDRVHALARAWELPDGAAVVMLPGRITEWKGHELLLDALARLRAHDPGRSVVGVMVGPVQSETYGRRLIERAERLGLRPMLRFAGHCNDMPAALALADLVVVPSLKPEPFGRAVVEAQAMGRPVVVAAHGAALETVEDGITGFCFPPGDAGLLASALHHVLALDPAERAALGARARAHVLERYTVAAMQAATLDVYDELLRTPFPPRHPPCPEPLAGKADPVVA